MRVAMHQPHYLPWLGYLDKIDRCDLFVVLDHVQYERKGWQNRNYLGSKNGPVLLTVPVVQRSRDERILDKHIDNSQQWRLKHRRSMADHCYSNAPFWDEFGSEFTAIYDREWHRLDELALATTNALLRCFGITTPVVRASELGDFPGQKSELLAQITAKVGATTMLSGDGARGYVDEEVFARYGVSVEWQNFAHPRYTQFWNPSTEFRPRLAAVDLLFNEGPAALDILRAARHSAQAPATHPSPGPSGVGPDQYRIPRTKD
ncbi:WbqC family protein [Lipingzhangella sp. LS1_29]|uniref:WbqC family protein n=1 Tax=Lipingzhangella rawalii TaxID=2055835 RepID=A0ABU2H421_9ACTN|nr:WbqC family protein [Lipingzhangella rawalii]MDS1270057.1 WbqC family protein [Lipingzhangella rawalii]